MTEELMKKKLSYQGARNEKFERSE